LTPDLRERIKNLVRDVKLSEVSERSGLGSEKILLIAHYLSDAKRSLVIAGGTAASSEQALPLMAVCNLINLVLGNVGKTITLKGMVKPKTSIAKLKKLCDQMQAAEFGKYGIVFVDSANPAYTLPGSLGFKYAIKKAELIVSFSSHLDETAQLADLILPSHVSLEDWGFVQIQASGYGLLQPTMKPVFDTRSFGDSLIQIAKRTKSEGLGADSYQAYVKKGWQNLFASLNLSVSERAAGFDRFWMQSLEQGGYFKSPTNEALPDLTTNVSVFKLDFSAPKFAHEEADRHDPIVMPFSSVKSFDGRAANRPWMQELPDPITTIVWDAWAEIHPTTAKTRGIKQGDMVTVRNYYGEINVPAYLTEFVHPEVIAVPLGQGHEAYGRYAKQVGGANVLELLPAAVSEETEGLALLSTRAVLKRGRVKGDLVVTQGSNSQFDRGIAQTVAIGGATHAASAHATHGDAHGHGHEPKQMYTQREHPLYEWALAVDLAACTGCAACVVACSAENNIPSVGKKVCSEGREMSWLRIERYYEGTAEELKVSFIPMMCQHCNNAPCEPVCPVYATYHNEEGMNVMVYNRCVGTRYCSNNCSYKVRRYNWYEYKAPEPLTWQYNPDVTVRSVGVMEKCTFCVQRIIETKDRAKDLGRPVEDGEVQPACVQSCPTRALTFGNMKDHTSQVYKLAHSERAYKVLDHHINTQPAVTYLRDLRYKA
ncbi:MAG: 4Fe-4S dicluster domain-containing protein, partial [Bdellovibrionales bacterium]|nr:4Fe-4S dicluster domain-containing protein [Bdellovibrionales bacterium]